MGEYTKNLNLFKYKIPEDNELSFSIERALNENWDKIDRIAENGLPSGGNGYALFDLVQKDHILTQEEKEGLELLGEYVYKESDGIKNGYPDFYNKCLEEYRTSIEEKIYEDIILPTFSANTQDGITISDSRNNTSIIQNILNGSKEYNQVGAWSTYWINIDYGKKVKLENYTITADGNGTCEHPSEWEVWGYNEKFDEPIEGENYTLLDSEISQTFTTGQAITYNINTAEEFSNYRIVFKNGVQTSDKNGEIKKITFNAKQYLYSIYTNENGHKFYPIVKKQELVYNYPQMKGVLQYNKGIISGFSSTAWADINKPFSPEGNWEIQLKVNITNLNNAQYILSSNESYQALSISLTSENKISARSYVNNANNSLFVITAQNPITKEDIYYIKLKFDIATGYSLEIQNSSKENIETVTNEITTKITQGQELAFGCDFQGKDKYYEAPFLGTIDIKESYIKDGNNYYWQGSYISQINTKDYIDKIYINTGVAWYYGVDEGNERILLPRNDYFFQNHKQVGKYIEAGLPNITGEICLDDVGLDNLTIDKNKNSFYYIRSQTNAAGSAAGLLAGFDASRSSAVYGKSNTVQPPAAGVVIYMVVGNTTIKRARSEVTEVATSENDTLPLFTGMYFDFKPNHISWIQAGEKANGKIYKSAYRELEGILNGEITKYGDNFKVTEESTKESEVDYSEYWVINREEETFTVPNKISYFPINKYIAPVKGNGMILGLTNGTKNYGAFGSGGNNYNRGNLAGNESRYGQKLDYTATSGGTWGESNNLGITTDPEKSGLIADLSGLKSENSRLYFKIGNALENQQLIDCGEVMEELNSKVNVEEAVSACFPSLRYVDFELGASGTAYYAPANGWIATRLKAEQGSYITVIHQTTLQELIQYKGVSAGGYLSAYMPVAKGNFVRVYYYNVTTTVDNYQTFVRFIYANGEENA